MRALHLLLPTIAIATVTPDIAPAAQLLAPHRAVYDLSLDNASDRSGITALTGRMVYEFEGSRCEGYTVTFRFVTRIESDESSRLSDMRTTTFEDGEGDRFSFVTTSYVDQSLDRELKGTATLKAEAIEVRLEKPEPKTFSVERAQFPTQHLLELIGKAKQSEHFYQTTIFDGSEDADRVLTTTVVIGSQEPVGQNDPERAAMDELRGDSFWPVEIAYFDLSEGNGDETPSYRIAFRLHENGVTRDLLMDYGDFAMKGQLVDLELLKPADEGCGQ